MKIIKAENVNLAALGIESGCRVFTLHVKIENIQDSVADITKIITDTSWVNNLDNFVERITFEARSRRTIEKIVEDILKKVQTEVTEDFGEYLVSYSAQFSLETEYSHTRLPMAELLKEKITGNPGFDFHTESQHKNIVFGEAKFSSTVTPRTEALSQILNFIDLQKDSAELIVLSPFVSIGAVINYAQEKKAYAAAFSFNGKNIQTIFSNALKSAEARFLMEYEELYLIAIEI
ncbi:MAG: hypothetical protein MUF19_02665 [Candidatus Pacebacteria bacterium]|nr:hypothetical protein [Candidatus Paceibacterota bacterium]